MNKKFINIIVVASFIAILLGFFLGVLLAIHFDKF